MANLAVFNQTIQMPKTQSYLESVLKEKKSSFVTSLVSVVANNANLQACEPVTIMYAAMKATALELPFDPNLGFAYVIPYSNHGKMEAQFQLGAKGLTQLAMRSGQFQTINVDVIYDGEISKRDKLSGDIELNGEKKSDKVVGYFAYFKLTNGFSKTLFLTLDEVKKHANRFSKAVNSGPWKTDFDAMAKKTVLKMLLSKYAPLSVEMQNGIKADQAIFRTEDMTEDYVDLQSQIDEQKQAQVDKVKSKAQAVKDRIKAATAAPKQEEEIDEQEPEVDPMKDVEIPVDEAVFDMDEEAL